MGRIRCPKRSLNPFDSRHGQSSCPHTLEISDTLNEGVNIKREIVLAEKDLVIPKIVH
jgi:hypothetical protein